MSAFRKAVLATRAAALAEAVARPCAFDYTEECLPDCRYHEGFHCARGEIEDDEAVLATRSAAPAEAAGMSGWIYDDGGRAAAGYKGTASDCTCRSIAIATGKPYQEVYDDLNALGKAERPRSSGSRSSARTGVLRSTIRRYMESLGWRWVPTMQVGSGCKVHLDAAELPKGRLVVSVSRHMTAMIDGVIHDTFDPRRSKSWSFERDRGQPLKPNQGRNQNGVWTEIGGRCVYGYFCEAVLATRAAALAEAAE